jgi:hypothetical protein
MIVGKYLYSINVEPLVADLNRMTWKSPAGLLRQGIKRDLIL